ncbi:HpcH/HpaI aldolase/citrate lyase family protein [Neptunicoccus cionae]|uniref:HpcH/HpaI aldolase/citrate lyase family protein n=1 Tax=Neptunicoccus cionae TaxID=2035344 RepID=UPI000C78D841|nr:CoA ester lyase [Amylibacter cionae]PLS20920.1 CoA ester lyase [Amylibacter cionae]
MWRSLLFIPVLEEKFLAKAASRGADAIALDLEASVASDRKDEARAALPDAVSRLAPQVDVTVRINALWTQAFRDLEVSVIEGVSAIHLPLCENAAQVRAVSEMIGELEKERGLPQGEIRLVALLESANAVLNARQIATASPRLLALTVGVEDYATSMGVSATPEVLAPAVQQVNLAARAASVASFAVAASMSDFRDVDGLRAAASYARAIGSTGGYAVHPAQVTVLNDVFSPTDAELGWAQRVVEAAETAARQGQGVTKLDGQMIDLPLVIRAQSIVARGQTSG